MQISSESRRLEAMYPSAQKMMVTMKIRKLLVLQVCSAEFLIFLVALKIICIGSAPCLLRVSPFLEANDYSSVSGTRTEKSTELVREGASPLGDQPHGVE